MKKLKSLPEASVYETPVFVGSRVRLSLPMLLSLSLSLAGVLAYAAFSKNHPINLTIAVYAAWLVLAPQVVAWIRRQWIASHNSLFEVIAFVMPATGETKSAWLESQHRKIFVTSWKWPVIFALAVLIGGYISIIPQREFLDNEPLTVFLLTIFGVVLLEAGHFIYMVLAASRCLWELPNMCGSSPWLSLLFRELRDFERTWLALAWLSGGAYILVLLGTLATPYGLDSPFNYWLIAFSFAPLVSAVFAVVGIQRVRERVKMMHLEWLSKQIECERLAAAPNWQDLESMSVLGDSMHRMREWPLSPLVATTLVTAVVTVGTSLLARNAG